VRIDPCFAGQQLGGNIEKLGGHSLVPAGTPPQEAKPVAGGTGVITAVPLLFFAAASRRLPLVWTGFIQFFAPVIQFLVGVLVLHEEMPVERWVGFGLVWLALVILTADTAAAARQPASRRNRNVQKGRLRSP
jgi:drug/metabolite transporter (DMT)-like permease